MSSFADFKLLPSIQKTLGHLGLTTPTEIQRRNVPLALAGRSVVGIAETGGGKTLAFVLPILHALKALEIAGQPIEVERRPRAVILAPTRDLGEQIARVFKSFTHDTRLRVRTALGGTAFEQARRNSADVFEVLLATPGRVAQLIERGLIDLSDVRSLVFDEADQLVDEGFLTVTREIARGCPAGVQMALFSATVPAGVRDLIAELFPGVEVVETRASGRVTATLTTNNLKVEHGRRLPLLEHLLKERVDGGTILFTNTREQCDQLAKQVRELGHACVTYRGEMDPAERRRNLKSFRTGEVRFLVSTDLAGRGLDVDHVARVINYHLPRDPQNYLHRAGRTARAGRPGVVVNLVTERDEDLISRMGGEPARGLSMRKPRRVNDRVEIGPHARRR